MIDTYFKGHLEESLKLLEDPAIYSIGGTISDDDIIMGANSVAWSLAPDFKVTYEKVPGGFKYTVSKRPNKGE